MGAFAPPTDYIASPFITLHAEINLEELDLDSISVLKPARQTSDRTVEITLTMQIVSQTSIPYPFFPRE